MNIRCAMSTLNNSPEVATKPSKKTRKAERPLNPTLLTPDELAVRWNVSTMTLRRWRAAGLLPAIRVGPRRLVFALSDVTAHEQAGRIGSRA